MLTDVERATAFEIVLACHDEKEFGVVNDRLCSEFPTITTEDLVSLWREAGERCLAEAESLKEFKRKRFAAASDA